MAIEYEKLWIPAQELRPGDTFRYMGTRHAVLVIEIETFHRPEDEEDDIQVRVFAMGVHPTFVLAYDDRRYVRRMRNGSACPS